MNLTPLHTATILAALRCYQHLYGNRSLSMPEDIREIATDGGKFPRMNTAGIDALCQSLNLSQDTDPSAIVEHLGGEFEAIRKALAEDNPGRADWLCRTAIDHIAKHATASSNPQSAIPDPQSEDPRRVTIIELAMDQYGGEEDIEIDENPLIYEGDGNGCFVSGCVWVSFSGTTLEKEPDEDACDDPRLTTSSCTASGID